MDPLFRPEGEWQQLPDVAALSHRINSLVINGALSLGIVAVVWFISFGTPWIMILTCAACLAWTFWRVVRIGRWIRAFGYREGRHDLLISRGLWFQSLTAIPYGRMLSVEVSTNPVSRLWGLSEVQLVTASQSSHARIPALRTPDAIRLRDQLIALGEEQALPL